MTLDDCLFKCGCVNSHLCFLEGFGFLNKTEDILLKAMVLRVASVLFFFFFFSVVKSCIHFEMRLDVSTLFEKD